MKTLILCTIVGVLAITAWYSLSGRALRATIGEQLHEVTGPTFDLHKAKEAVRDLRSEVLREQRSLSELSRTLERSQQRLGTLRESVATMAEQISAGAALLEQEGPYHIQGRPWSRSELEHQIERYLSQRSHYRREQEHLERHLVALAQKKAEMDAAVAAKRLRVEDYEAQIALVEIDARFQSVADRFQVRDGNHRIQHLIDRVSDQVSPVPGVNTDAPAIDFLAPESDLRQRISEELATP